MASSIDFNLPNLVVDNYEAKDVIALASRYLKIICSNSSKQVQAQNMYGAVACMRDVQIVSDILSALDTKMNGQKDLNIVE